MKIIAVIGDFYHPAAILQEGLGPLAGGADSIRFIDTKDAMPWGELASADILILSKAGYDFVKPPVADWMGERVGELAQAVHDGLGLVIVHSGLSGFENNPAMLHLAKACFTHHPHGLVRVDLEWAQSAGQAPGRAGSFQDEQYFMKFVHADTRVFMHTVSEGFGKAEGGWRHEYGQGRIVCLSPGHTADAFKDADYQDSLAQALTWATRRVAKPAMVGSPS